MNYQTKIIGPSRELTPNDVRATYVPNGVDPSAFTPADRRERPVVIVCARRWAPTKGVDLFVDSLLRLPLDVVSQSVVIFAGDIGSDYPKYAERVEASLRRYTGQVQRLGSIGYREMVHLLSRAHLAVLPSREEATSLSALEAMSSGVTVVATAVGGLPEIVDHGATGYLVPPESPDALSQTVSAFVRGQLAPTGHEARRRIIESYSWDVIADKTARILSEAVADYCASSQT